MSSSLNLIQMKTNAFSDLLWLFYSKRERITVAGSEVSLEESLSDIFLFEKERFEVRFSFLINWESQA